MQRTISRGSGAYRRWRWRSSGEGERQRLTWRPVFWNVHRARGALLPSPPIFSSSLRVLSHAHFFPFCLSLSLFSSLHSPKRKRTIRIGRIYYNLGQRLYNLRINLISHPYQPATTSNVNRSNHISFQYRAHCCNETRFSEWENECRVASSRLDSINHRFDYALCGSFWGNILNLHTHTIHFIF